MGFWDFLLQLLNPPPPRVNKPSVEVWFSPNVGAPDFLRLFTHPEEWSHSRAKINVFEFIQWQITPTPNPLVGPNTLQALVEVGAFKFLKENNIKLAIAAGAVKEYSCTDGGVSNVAALLQSIDLITGAGGEVTYVEMDEPFTSGIGGCGWTAHQTAGHVEDFMRRVWVRYPAIKFGLVEAYPTHPPGMLLLFTELLPDLAFLHIDIDHYRVRREGTNIYGDLRHLQGSVKIPFSAVIWGERGDTDAHFTEDALALAGRIETAIGLKTQDHIMFQSWAVALDNAKTHPTLLPEDKMNTHTWLVNRVL